VFPDNPVFSRPEIPATEIFPAVNGASGGLVGHGDSNGGSAAPAGSSVAPGLNPELVRRFQALIEEVTGELMQDPHQDEGRCRADAIALLMATCEHVESPPEPGPSPLRYLLQEEQRKAVAAWGGVEMSDDTSTFLRA
jgi:hypothetical protein